MFHSLRKQKPFMAHNRREPSKGPQFIESLISCIGCLVVCFMFYAISAILQSFDGLQTRNIFKQNHRQYQINRYLKFFFTKQTLTNGSNLSFDVIKFQIKYIEVHDIMIIRIIKTQCLKIQNTTVNMPLVYHTNAIVIW